MLRKEPVTAVAWAGFVALAIALGIGRFAFTPMLPMIQRDLGLDLGEGGWLASANYFGYFAGALTAAYLPWSASTLLRIGLILVALTTGLMGLTTAWPTWFAWRAVAGIASAWVLVATASLCLAQLSTTGSPRTSGLVFAGVGSGIALAGTLCMGANLNGIDASDTWLILAAVAAIALWATRPLWRISTRTASSLHPDPDTGLTGQARLITAYGFFGFGYILPATFLPAQARHLLDDSALFGLAWPVFGIAAAISTLICSALPRLVPRRWVWLAAQLTMAIGVVLPALFPGLASIVLAALFVGGTFMVITMLGMQQAQLSGGNSARALMAALTAAFAAGQLLGPVVFSLLHVHMGATLNSALYLAGATLVAGCLLLLRPFPESTAP